METVTGKATLPEEITRCDGCGNSSTLGQFFQRGRRGQRFCPRCALRERNRTTLFSYLFLVFSGLFMAAFVGTVEGRFAVNVLANFLLWIPITILLIPLHEAVHALAARGLGGEVFEVAIGVGSPFWVRQWGRTRFSLRRYLIMGLCVAGFPQRRLNRLRLALYVVAPLCVHLILVWLLWPTLRADRLIFALAWREVLVFANLLVLAVNLFPRQIGAMGIGTDGLTLLNLLLGRLSTDQIHRSYFVLASGYAFQRHHASETVALAEAGLACYPDDPLLQLNRLAGLLAGGRYQAALEAAQALLAAGADDQPLLQTLLLNNMAWAILMLHVEKKLDETPWTLAQGYEYAARAFRTMPWEPSVEGTWGGHLLERGEVERGVDHLLAAARWQELDHNRGVNLAHAAMGYRRLGREEDARPLLQEALRLAPDEPLVLAAAQELAMTAA